MTQKEARNIVYKALASKYVLKEHDEIFEAVMELLLASTLLEKMERVKE